MYTDDNNGFFPTRTATSGRWINVLFDYYRDDKIRCCPMGTKIAVPYYLPGGIATPEIGGGPFTSWGRLSDAVGPPSGAALTRHLLPMKARRHALCA